MLGFFSNKKSLISLNSSFSKELDHVNILYLVFLANTCEDKIYKKKIKYEIIAKLNMLNFYLERYYLLKYISKKEVIINSSKIEELTKMTYGWIKYDRK